MKKYLCGVTFEWELGETDDIGIYDTLEEVERIKCAEECGIVEIEIEDESKPEKYTSHKWIKKQSFNWTKK